MMVWCANCGSTNLDTGYNCLDCGYTKPLVKSKSPSTCECHGMTECPSKCTLRGSIVCDAKQGPDCNNFQ